MQTSVLMNNNKSSDSSLSTVLCENQSSASDSVKRKSPLKLEIPNVLCENQSMISSDSLKRKRPPKIEIPSVLCENIRTDSEPCFKNIGTTPKRFGGHGVGLFCQKGKKTLMEDTHKIISTSNAKRGFFGVYDGHGGRKAAAFVAENLHSFVFEMLDNSSSTTREKAVEAAYLKTDHEFLKLGLGSGACCVTAVIEGKEVLVSNVGDCRAVLCRGGVAQALTRDHRAEREDEQKRIEDKGGYVELHRGGWRVHGVLSVSRSIGDAHLKDWVPAEPDTKTLILTPDMEYLVLASDGLWDKVGNQEAVDLITKSEKRKQELEVADVNEKGVKFDSVSKSHPSSKLRRVSLIKSNRRKNRSPKSCQKKNISSWMESEDEFGNENESPPTKARRVLTVNHVEMKMKIYPSDEENSKGLVDACRQLVNLAVLRGSSDDITVMIIDLSHFIT